ELGIRTRDDRVHLECVLRERAAENALGFLLERVYVGAAFRGVPRHRGRVHAGREAKHNTRDPKPPKHAAQHSVLYEVQLLKLCSPHSALSTSCATRSADSSAPSM